MTLTHHQAVMDGRSCLVLVRKPQHDTFSYAAILELKFILYPCEEKMLNRFVSIKNTLPKISPVHIRTVHVCLVWLVIEWRSRLHHTVMGLLDDTQFLTI